MTQNEMEKLIRDEMNQQFVNEIKFTIADAAKILDGLRNVFFKVLEIDRKLHIPGFGTFYIVKRICRNPASGEKFVANTVKYKMSSIMRKFSHDLPDDGSELYVSHPERNKEE